jgi:hypothetical protein
MSQQRAVRNVEWAFETDLGVFGQVAAGVVFVFDAKREPLTVIDEAAVQVEIDRPVLVRDTNGAWVSYDWGTIVNTLRFRRP